MASQKATMRTPVEQEHRTNTRKANSNPLRNLAAAAAVPTAAVYPKPVRDLTPQLNGNKRAKKDETEEAEEEEEAEEGENGEEEMEDSDDEEKQRQIAAELAVSRQKQQQQQYRANDAPQRFSALKPDTHYDPLSEILKEGDQLFIQYFQRPYSWRRTECLRLMTDLIKAMKEDPRVELYLGNITLAGSEEEKKKFSILDGQQRLTTFTLIIAILREAFFRAQHCAQEKEGEAGLYVENCEKLLFTRIWSNNTRALEKRPILVVSDSVSEIFKTYIHCPTPKSFDDLDPAKFEGNSLQQTIVTAIQTIKSALDEAFRGNLQELIKFFEFVVNNAKFITFKIGTSNNPQERRNLFISINDTGLPLSPEDKLKTHLLGFVEEFHLKRRETSVFNSKCERWETLAGCLGTYTKSLVIGDDHPLNGFQALFRLYAILKLQKVDVVHECHDAIKSLLTSQDKAVEVLDEILEYGEVYLCILSGKIPELSEQTEIAVNVEVMLKIFVHIPPQFDLGWQLVLLKFLKACCNVSTTVSIDYCISICLKFVATALLIQNSSTTQETYFTNACIELATTPSSDLETDLKNLEFMKYQLLLKKFSKRLETEYSKMSFVGYGRCHIQKLIYTREINSKASTPMFFILCLYGYIVACSESLRTELKNFAASLPDFSFRGLDTVGKNSKLYLVSYEPAVRRRRKRSASGTRTLGNVVARHTLVENQSTSVKDSKLILNMNSDSLPVKDRHTIMLENFDSWILLDPYELSKNFKL